MGDPFSVAGTAVGITSLGIQTCQILHRYYSRYRGHHDDIEAVLRQVEGLQGIIRGLEQVKGRIEIDNHEPSSQLHMALLACQDVLEKLESMAHNCQAEKDPGDVQARIRAVLNRSAWPFRKDTLADLMDTLGRFQDNVSLALQSAGLDAVLREVDGIQPALGSLHAQNMVIQERQGHQLDALRSVHGDVATSFEYQRWSHQEISHDLSDVQRQLSQYGETLQFITKTLIASSASPRDLNTVSPSLLSEAAHTVDEIAPAFETTLYKHRNLFHESDMRRTRGTAIAAYCLWYKYADYSETFAMQFIFSTRVVGACIQAGLQRSRRGGWASVAPTLRYRAVRPDSVAFKILRKAWKRIYAQGQVHGWIGHNALPHLASETFSALQVCFGKDAHPTDLNKDGNGIMTYVLYFFIKLIDYGYSDGSMLCTFIDACITQGIPVDQDDAREQTPAMLWQFHMQAALEIETDDRVIDTYREVLMHLTRKLDLWMVNSTAFLVDIGALKYYEIISCMMRIEDLNSSLDEDDSLARAILARSETQVASFLNFAKVTSWESLVERYLLMDAIACWPEAVQLVIQSGLFEPSERIVVGIWKSAIEYRAWDTLQIFLDFGVQVTWEDWEELNWHHPFQGRYLACQQETVDQEAEVYRSMATRLLRDSEALPGSPSTGDIDSPMASSHEMKTLYHASDLSVQGAEGAWLAGLHDLNTVCGITGTPLWVCVSEPHSHRFSMWKTARWLLSHGADPAWIHPVYLTTPAHILIRLSVAQACFENARAEAKFVSEVTSHLGPVTEVCNMLLGAVHRYHPDECVCHCSKNGCSVISCATSKKCVSLRGNSYELGYECKSLSPDEYVYQRKAIRPFLFSLVERADQPDQIATSILRVLTFEKLKLPHTCCYRVLDELDHCSDFKRPTLSEAMYDTNPRDLELLETLMDEFEAKWTTYKKPFATFVKRVWNPRMRQIRKEREVNQEIYEAELVRMGIRLHQPGEPSPQNVESEIGYDSAYIVDWDSETSSESEESEIKSEDENENDGYLTADEEVEEELEERQEVATSDERERDESGGAEDVRE